ncbi:magnesium/nickel/cobalt transporter CorA [Klebsiella pneumoniae]|uniref:Magnesium/nickel/cobalt transporter CorA n=1 Tax=Klebsiella pneumoniae TaxID=573 RepID=A0A377UV14_KLEPN|nr:magnesium/nickel/cobalt transporter CorA [Klebsiella pneumoniae]
MLSAFQLENNRLTRLEADEIKHLASSGGSIWSSLTTMSEAACRRNWVKTWATRPELEDIEASARFFEDEDGLHIHSFFFFEDADDHAGNSTRGVYHPRKAACSRYASANYPLSPLPYARA